MQGRRGKPGAWTTWIVLASALTLAPSAAGAAGAELIGGGDAPALFLLYTGDVIGYIDPCG